MAIPTGYIFQSGTCLKNEIYQLIIDKLVAAGWEDISSNPATDFVVLKSTGNTEDKELILNIRDTNATNVNSVVSTNFCVMSYRLQDTYIPGDEGVAGIFGRPSLAWTVLHLVPVALATQLGADTEIAYKVYADASKIILALEYPNATGYNPILIYMGLPDTLLASDPGNRGTLIAVTNNAPAATSLAICNTSEGMASVAAPYTLTTSALLPLGDPNMGNRRMVSSIYYGNGSESFRGKLDGIKCLLNTKINTGDQVIIGAETYYALVCHALGNNSYPSVALLVRTV